MYLDECINHLNSEGGFPEGWYSQYDFSPENKEESYKEIIVRVSSSFSFLFNQLNRSILAGEFVLGEVYNSKLEEVFKTISEIEMDLETPTIETNQELFHIINNSLSKPLTIARQHILSLSHALNKKLKYKGSKWLFTAERNPIIDLDNSFVSNTKEHLHLLKLNTQLSIIDFELGLDKKQLATLIIAKRELSFITKAYPSLDIVKDKCNYLIRKVLFRISQDEENSYLYAIDYQDKELSTEELNPGAFSPFDLISRKHYSLNNAGSRSFDLESTREKVRKGESLTYLEIHGLIKESKDSNNSYSQVKSTLDIFNKSYEGDISSNSLTAFDKYALSTMKNYMLNNEFSIFLAKESSSLKDIESKLDEIRDVQFSTGIKNYFPFYKFCNYLVYSLNQLFKAPSLDYKLALSLHAKLKAALRESYDCFEWCKDRNFLAFQLPFSECQIDNENIDFKLFLSSSFVLPINFEKVQLELTELSRKDAKFLTLLEVHQNIEKHDQELTNFRAQLAKSEGRSIEVLGVFSAIVLFASGSIQIFSIKGLSMHDAITFMLAFSYSLVLFIFLIWLITRENITHVTAIHKNFFKGLVAVTVLSLGYILWGGFKKEKNVKETKSVKVLVIDSHSNKPNFKGNNSSLIQPSIDSNTLVGGTQKDTVLINKLMDSNSFQSKPANVNGATMNKNK